MTVNGVGMERKCGSRKTGHSRTPTYIYIYALASAPAIDQFLGAGRDRGRGPECVVARPGAKSHVGCYFWRARFGGRRITGHAGAATESDERMDGRYITLTGTAASTPGATRRAPRQRRSLTVEYDHTERGRRSSDAPRSLIAFPAALRAPTKTLGRPRRAVADQEGIAGGEGVFERDGGEILN